jgi:hypothetical protein
VDGRRIGSPSGQTAGHPGTGKHGKSPCSGGWSSVEQKDNELAARTRRPGPVGPVRGCLAALPHRCRPERQPPTERIRGPSADGFLLLLLTRPKTRSVGYHDFQFFFTPVSRSGAGNTDGSGLTSRRLRGAAAAGRRPGRPPAAWTNASADRSRQFWLAPRADVGIKPELAMAKLSNEQDHRP